MNLTRSRSLSKTAGMNYPFALRFAQNVRFTRNASGKIEMELGFRRVAFADAGKRSSLMGIRGENPVPVEYVAVMEGKPALALRPMTADFSLDYRPLEADEPLRASRFALMRRHDEQMILETPLSHARVWCLEPTVGVLWATLAQPVTPRQVSDSMGLPLADCTHCLELLVCAGLVAPTDKTGRLGEDGDAVLRLWTHHEALFHARSRRGRHDDPFGATYRFRGEIPPPPALRAPYDGPMIPLARVELKRLQLEDASLTQVLEKRRSLRCFDNASPLNLEKLGHFLYRVARLTKSPNPSQDRIYDVVWHVYPTGGGMGDLEVYVVAANCQGLSRGAYHYDALQHSLTQLSQAPVRAVDLLLEEAKHSSGITTDLHVLLLFSSRLTRGLWKYSAMYYATALKDVGALMQTCYLVATAMGLAPCSLGAGNADLFASVTGCNYLEESSVGEFMLGTATVS